MSGLRGQLERAITDALERAGRALSPTTRRIVGRAVEHVVEPMIYQLVAERDQARAELEALHATRSRDVPEGSRTT